MANTKISEYSSTPGNNTDIDGINIAEGCAPSGINNAIRELMSQLKDFQAGTAGDSFNGPHNGTVGATTPASGAFTTLSSTGNTTLGNDSGDVITINGTTTFGSGATVSSPLALSAGTASAPALTTTGDTNTGIFFPAADTIAFAEGGAEVARFDSPGNLGLGVTPSAWFSTRKVFQMASFSNLASFTGSAGFELRCNAFLNTSAQEIYLNSEAATLYGTSAGQHRWYTAPSGTAGNAISFTQAMTLDASGNLALGTTSAPYQAGGRTVLGINGSSNSILGFMSAGTARGYVYADSTIMSIEAESPCQLKFNTIGAQPMTFFTSNTERARIDSSGNLLVGTTSSGSLSGNCFAFLPSGGAYGVIGHANGTGSGTFYLGFTYNGSAIGSVTQVGTTGVLYNVTSDQRLKENIVNAPEFGSVIDSIQVRSFDWKTDQTHQRAGFVAQELVTVAPEAVYQPAHPEEMMAVDYSKLVPMLVKEIQSLRARVTALESN
jgi:hypothetical protein